MRLATYASKCIENEILMHFRGQKKTAGDVSLSEALDADGEGEGLALLDTISMNVTGSIRSSPPLAYYAAWGGMFRQNAQNRI